MLNWLKNKKSSDQAPREHPYYGARVRVGKEKIYLNQTNGDHQSISKEVIAVAIHSYCGEKSNDEYWIILQPPLEANITVTSRAGGLKQLEQWLFSLEDFDQAAYTHATKEAGKEAVVVWKVNITPNASIMNYNRKNDAALDEGIWLEKRDVLLPWGTFNDLGEIETIQKSAVDLPNPAYKQYSYKLKDAQILHGIQVDELTFKTPSWRKEDQFNGDWPVTELFTHARLNSPVGDSYQQLKAHLTKHFGEPDYENEFQSSTNVAWAKGDNKIELSKARYQGIAMMQPYCLLRISYTPNVDRFYQGAYTQKLQLQEQLMYEYLPISLKVNSHYVNHPNTRYTPPCFSDGFESDTQGAIWRDKAAGKIGFGDPDMCQIFDSNQLSQIVLVAHYWRDSLSGYTLEVEDTSGKKYAVGEFELPEAADSLQKMIDRLEDVTDLPIHFFEDRQYY